MVMCPCHVGHKWLKLIITLWTTTLKAEAVLHQQLERGGAWEIFEFYPQAEGTSTAVFGGNSLSFVHWQMHGSTGDGDLKTNSSRNLSQPVAPPFGSSFVASKLVPVGMGSCGGCLPLHYAVKKMKWALRIDWIEHWFDKWQRCHFFLYYSLDLDGFLIVAPFLQLTFFFCLCRFQLILGKWAIYILLLVCPSP